MKEVSLVELHKESGVKFTVNTLTSGIIQKELFKNGWSWLDESTFIKHIDEPYIYMWDSKRVCYSDKVSGLSYFNSSNFTQITISGLNLTELIKEPVGDRREKLTAKNKIRACLEKAEGWEVHTPFHFSKFVLGSRLDYWPSSKKFMYKGKVQQGSVEKVLVDLKKEVSGLLNRVIKLEEEIKLLKANQGLSE